MQHEDLPNSYISLFFCAEIIYVYGDSIAITTWPLFWCPPRLESKSGQPNGRADPLTFYKLNTMRELRILLRFFIQTRLDMAMWNVTLRSAAAHTVVDLQS